MRRGTLSRSAIAVAAMASGGEMIAPRTNPVASGGSMKWWASRATATAVKRKRPTASSEMGGRVARKWRQEVHREAGKRRGGRKKRKTNSESSRAFGNLGI